MEGMDQTLESGCTVVAEAVEVAVAVAIPGLIPTEPAGAGEEQVVAGLLRVVQEVREPAVASASLDTTPQ
jgi:hypothetical protein